MREGAERRKGASVTNWHLMEVPRAVVTRHARLPALHRGDFGPCHRTSSSDRSGVTTQRDPGSKLVLPFIRQVAATQGGPLSGGGRRPNLLGRACEARLQAP